jgi:hypothetical protein
MAVELQEQLLTQERVPDSREITLMAREDGMVLSALGRACTNCVTECNRVEAVRQDYRARICAFTACCRRSFDFKRVLEGRRFLLSL